MMKTPSNLSGHNIENYRKEFEFSFLELLKILFRRWLGIVVIIATFLVLARINHGKETPVYYAKALLMINSQHGFGDSGFFIGGTPSLTTDIALMQSVPMGEQVVRELYRSSKRDSLEFFGQRRYTPSLFRFINRAQASTFLQKPKPVSFSENDIRRYTMMIQGRIRITPVSGTNLLNISVSSPFPDESVFLTNTLCTVYKNDDKERNAEKYYQARKYLSAMLQEQQKKVDAADSAISTFMQSNDIFDSSANIQQLYGNVTGFDTKYQNIISESKIARNSLDFLETTLSNADKAISLRIAKSVNNQLGAIQDEIKASESAYMLLLREKSSSDPAVIAKRRELDVVKSRYEQLSRSKIAGEISYAGRTQKYKFDLVSEKLQIERKLNELEFSAGEYRRLKEYYAAQLDKMPQKQQVYLKLKSQQEVVGKTYAFLQGKLEDVSVSLASEVGRVAIVGPAFLPSSPEKPDYMKNMLSGLIKGIFFALIFTVVAEVLDDTVKDEAYLKGLGLTVLSVIPVVTQNGKSAFSGQRLSRLARRLYSKRVELGNQFFASSYKGKGNGSSVKAPELPMPKITDNMSSLFSESFRTLRTSLDYLCIDTPLKSILISGTAMSEGKSTICANLGMAYALIGKKTLIVDCDLRRTSLHNKFNTKQEPGLTDYLFSSRHKIDGSFFQPTHLENLFLLSAGKKVPNPNELLGSGKMLELLKELEGMFDMVLFDSPPLFLSDAAQLARSVDATLLAVRFKYTSKKPLKGYVSDTVLQTLTLGVVAITSSDSGRYGYGKYGYGKYEEGV